MTLTFCHNRQKTLCLFASLLILSLVACEGDIYESDNSNEIGFSSASSSNSGSSNIESVNSPPLPSSDVNSSSEDDNPTWPPFSPLETTADASTGSSMSNGIQNESSSDSPTDTLQGTLVTPTPSNNLSLTRDLSPEEAIELSYSTGGASDFYHYGLSEKCLEAQNGSLYVALTGVFSTKDQYQEAPFWGTKYSSCKEKLEFGDMVYFVVRGFQMGETVDFLVRGPHGNEQYSITVDQITLIDKATGSIREEFPGARFSWIASPTLGAGDFVLIASSSSGTVSLPFKVYESEAPNFGVKFGSDEIHPLLLTDQAKLTFVLTGFPSNHTVKILLYQDPFSVTDLLVSSSTDTNNSTLKKSFEIEVNSEGNAVEELDWPNDLPPGLYSLLIPEIIRSEPFETESLWIYDPSDGPPLYSIQFGVQRNTEFPNQTGVDSLGSVSYRVVNVQSDDVLNVRSGPGANYLILGTIPYNGTDVQVTGEGITIGDSWWVPIFYEGIFGWVNTSYLVEQNNP
ncbi:MAG TPA: SH3 domain-containing protein [Chloroflexota bacterium]|nr:SH3 domain-containing protein [Chloroflexota bacterium]